MSVSQVPYVISKDHSWSVTNPMPASEIKPAAGITRKRTFTHRFSMSVTLYSWPKESSIVAIS
jgi:hypothetical protein